MSDAPPEQAEYLLAQPTLGRLRQRAAQHQEGGLPHPTSRDELRDTGFPVVAVPVTFGGYGRNLRQYARELGRLAMFDPVLAFAANTGVAWTGVAADLLRTGDISLVSLLRRDAEDRELKPPAGWIVTGCRRDTVTAWRESSAASIYSGIATRAAEIAIDTTRTSSAVRGDSRMVRHEVAEMVVAREAAAAIVEKATRDWCDGIEYGPLFDLKYASTRQVAFDAAEHILALAMHHPGARDDHELARLSEVVGLPGTSCRTHDLIARAALGAGGRGVAAMAR